jgi:plastocyanin
MFSKKQLGYLILILVALLSIYLSQKFLIEYNKTGFETEIFTDVQEVLVTLTPSGYEPSDFSIKKGTTVTFKNTTGKPHWPASNLHPTHEIYSEFDPQRPLAPDEAWSFTFNKVGTWNFHDHIRSYYSGKIYVTE